MKPFTIRYFSRFVADFDSQSMKAFSPTIAAQINPSQILIPKVKYVSIYKSLLKWIQVNLDSRIMKVFTNRYSNQSGANLDPRCIKVLANRYPNEFEQNPGPQILKVVINR